METYTDFYFNGKFLSFFNGVIASESGMLQLSLAPSVEAVTAKPYGYDGLRVVHSYVNPRTFSVPVLFDNLDENKIRDIASWLTVKQPQDFYFVYQNRNRKLKVMLDNGIESINRLGYAAGTVELKFIAYDPYYYEIDPLTIEGVLGASTAAIPTHNYGNIECYPDIELFNCTDTVVLETGGKTWTISDCPSNIYIDNLKRRIYNPANGENLFNHITLPDDNSWISFQPVMFNETINITAQAATSYKIRVNKRWL